MNSSQASLVTKFRVGMFTALSLALLGVMTVFVNDKPFWWRKCELVWINIDDATGLKSKSPVKSLGIQIGYLKSIELQETHVRMGICITAPVEILPTTRAYIAGEGLLGDKFVELKPVRYYGGVKEVSYNFQLISEAMADENPSASPSPATRQASDESPGVAVKHNEREIPVGQKSGDMQHLIHQVDGLVTEMTSLTNNLKEAINPKELRSTMQQLNKTLENASKTLSPEGGITTTAQRTLSKLEDAIEQLRDMLTRINKGEGSVGMLLNDPIYADLVRQSLENLNKVLSKFSGIRLNIDIYGELHPAYNGARGGMRLSIWPRFDRYYLLGATVDPRGKKTVTTTTTSSGGVSTNTTTTQVEQSGILFTAMLGKIYFKRLDLSIGFFHGDGTLSAAGKLGPIDFEEMAVFRTDFYSRGQGSGLEERLSLQVRPGIHSRWISNIYVKGGLESLKKVNGKTAVFYGAGITFDDDDIKMLFSFL